MRHANGNIWYGVDVDGPEGVRDNMEAFVWEPSLVKVNAISSAAEAACLILSVDETVRNPQSEQVILIVQSHFIVLIDLLASIRTSSTTWSGAAGAKRARKRDAKAIIT